MPSGISLVGRKFGKLKVLRETSTEDIYVCQCKCGRKVNLFRSQLTKSVVRHCGCSRKNSNPKAKNTYQKFRSTEFAHIRSYTTRDGRQLQKYSSEMLSYTAMKNRCLYKSLPAYQEYGARGIMICPRWLVRNGQGFRNFIADMGPRPIGKTLDRINVQGHYEPDNCRWADDDTQNANRRNILFPDGDAPPVADTLMDPEAEFAVI